MKTLVYFASKTGALAECVEKLKPLLKGDVTIIRHGGKEKAPDPSSFDRVLLGATIRAGKIQNPIREYAERHFMELKKKYVGIFLGCLTPPEKAAGYFNSNFPVDLAAMATKSVFGGAVYYEKMNFLERFIIKSISKKKESFTAFHENNIKEFVRDIA